MFNIKVKRIERMIEMMMLPMQPMRILIPPLLVIMLFYPFWKELNKKGIVLVLIAREDGQFFMQLFNSISESFQNKNS